MKKLTGLNEPLKNLDGQPLVDQQNQQIKIKRILAETIRRGGNTDERGQQLYDSMRAEKIAWDIYNGKDSIELDDADIQMIKGIVEKDGLLSNMSRAACLALFNDK